MDCPLLREPILTESQNDKTQGLPWQHTAIFFSAQADARYAIGEECIATCILKPDEAHHDFSLYRLHRIIADWPREQLDLHTKQFFDNC